LSYCQKLSILELDRLHLRRIKADLLLCYKIIRPNNLVDVDVSTFLFSRTTGLQEATVLSSKSPTVVLHARDANFFKSCYKYLELVAIAYCPGSKCSNL